MILLLILISFVPVILLARYIYNKDSEKESTSLLIKLFLSGILSLVIVIIINILIMLYIPDYYLANNSHKFNNFSIFILIFIEVALVEELSKWIMARFIGYKSKEFDQIFDIIVYSVFISLGFAAVENLFYVMEEGVKVGILRAFLSVPAHASFGVFMGYYLGLAKLVGKESKFKYMRNMILSIIVPTVLHTVFDYCLEISSSMLLIAFFAFVILIYILSVQRIDKFAKIKKPLD